MKAVLQLASVWFNSSDLFSLKLLLGKGAFTLSLVKSLVDGSEDVIL